MLWRRCAAQKTVFRPAPPLSVVQTALDARAAAVAQLRGKGGFSSAVGTGHMLGQQGTHGAGVGNVAHGFPAPKISIVGGAAGARGSGAGGGAAAQDGVDPNAGQAEDAFPLPAEPPLPAPVPPATKAGRARAGDGGGGGGKGAGVTGASAGEGGADAGVAKAVVDAVQAHAHSVRGGRKRVGDGAGAGAVTATGAAQGSGAAGTHDQRQQQAGQHGDFLQTSRGGAKRIVPAFTQQAVAQHPQPASTGAAGGKGRSRGGAAAEDSSAVPPEEPTDPKMKEWLRLQDLELERWQREHKGGAPQQPLCCCLLCLGAPPRHIQPPLRDHLLALLTLPFAVTTPNDCSQR